jgi:hypothetical protein
MDTASAQPGRLGRDRFTELARWLPRVVYFVIVGIMVWQLFKGYAQIAATYP